MTGDLFAPPQSSKFRPWFLAALAADKTDRCQLCEYWQSSDGKQGECNGPELQLGSTRSFDLCEQFVIVDISGNALYEVRGYDMKGKTV